MTENQKLREAAQNALVTLDGIANTNPLDTSDFETPAYWIEWAKSRSRWAADALRSPIAQEVYAERILKKMLTEQEAALALPTADHREAITMEAIIQQYSIDRDDANWLRSLLPSVATQTTAGEIVPTAEQPNLSDPAVQKRLAAQWGYVLPTAAPVDERELPPLPEPVTIDTHESGYRIRGYTAEQMRAYARASLQSVADAVLAEREACAKVCDAQHDRARTSTGACRADACAKAIRAPVLRQVYRRQLRMHSRARHAVRWPAT